MKTKPISRRKLIKDTAMAAVAGTLYMSLPSTLFASSGATTKVVLIRDKDVLDPAGNIDNEIISDMLDKAINELMGENDIGTAWSRLIKPDDVVGIKTNVWDRLPTPPGLEQAIKKRVMQQGVPEKNIGIKDRGIHSDELFQRSTALINTRPMRTHAWSGVGSLIKNYITFTAKPWELHDDSCADLATVWEYPAAKGKTRLNILVMLTPLFHGVGPHHFNKEYTWAYNGLIAGIDPVAVDAVGIRILQAKRREYFGEERPINPPPKHIAMADTRHRLGTADPSKINLVTLGWQEDLLLADEMSIYNK